METPLKPKPSSLRKKTLTTERAWETPFPSSITPLLLSNWVKSIPTPFYIYDLATLKRRINEVKHFPVPQSVWFSGFTPRYAIKSNPNLALLNIFHEAGIAFDASSEFEVERILRAKIPAHRILLTAQQTPRNKAMFKHYFGFGLEYNANSLYQLEWYGQLCPGQEVSLRINPGFGSGMDHKTTVGGKDSGFGIWHEYLPELQTLLSKYNLRVKRLHTHVGSGSDPDTWEKVITTSLKLIEHFPDAYVLNIGGGFKVSRNPDGACANLNVIGKRVSHILKKYLTKHQRKLHFEIEPGTYYIAEAGLLIARVEDVLTTGNLNNPADLTHFVKLNCGMNDLIRPTLYHSRHHIDLIPFKKSRKKSKSTTHPYIVIGHCCESGDLLSQNLESGSSYSKKGTFLFNNPQPDDLTVIHSTGAYGSAMSSRYNSFPLAGEYLYKGRKQPLRTIRKPETFEDVVRNDLP